MIHCYNVADLDVDDSGTENKTALYLFVSHIGETLCMFVWSQWRHPNLRFQRQVKLHARHMLPARIILMPFSVRSAQYITRAQLDQRIEKSSFTILLVWLVQEAGSLRTSTCCAIVLSVRTLKYRLLHDGLENADSLYRCSTTLAQLVPPAD